MTESPTPRVPGIMLCESFGDAPGGRVSLNGVLHAADARAFPAFATFGVYFAVTGLPAGDTRLVLRLLLDEGGRTPPGQLHRVAFNVTDWAPGKVYEVRRG